MSKKTFQNHHYDTIMLLQTINYYLSSTNNNENIKCSLVPNLVNNKHQ